MIGYTLAYQMRKEEGTEPKVRKESSMKKEKIIQRKNRHVRSRDKTWAKPRRAGLRGLIHREILAPTQRSGRHTI